MGDWHRCRSGPLPGTRRCAKVASRHRPRCPARPDHRIRQPRACFATDGRTQCMHAARLRPQRTESGRASRPSTPTNAWTSDGPAAGGQRLRRHVRSQAVRSRSWSQRRLPGGRAGSRRRHADAAPARVAFAHAWPSWRRPTRLALWNGAVRARSSGAQETPELGSMRLRQPT